MDIELWKARKKKLKMTFGELSDISGIPRSTLFDIFRGVTTSPSIDTVQRIEQALGIGWTDEELAAGIRPTVVRNLSPDEDELLELFREIGESRGSATQNNILQLMRDMLKNR